MRKLAANHETNASLGLEKSEIKQGLPVINHEAACLTGVNPLQHAVLEAAAAPDFEDSGFSIRGYVAAMREMDVKKCWPFSGRLWDKCMEMIPQRQQDDAEKKQEKQKQAPGESSRRLLEKQAEAPSQSPMGCEAWREKQEAHMSGGLAEEGSWGGKQKGDKKQEKQRRKPPRQEETPPLCELWREFVKLHYSEVNCSEAMLQGKCPLCIVFTSPLSTTSFFKAHLHQHLLAHHHHGAASQSSTQETLGNVHKEPDTGEKNHAHLQVCSPHPHDMEANDASEFDDLHSLFRKRPRQNPVYKSLRRVLSSAKRITTTTSYDTQQKASSDVSICKTQEVSLDVPVHENGKTGPMTGVAETIDGTQHQDTRETTSTPSSVFHDTRGEKKDVGSQHEDRLQEEKVHQKEGDISSKSDTIQDIKELGIRSSENLGEQLCCTSTARPCPGKQATKTSSNCRNGMQVQASKENMSTHAGLLALRKHGIRAMTRTSVPRRLRDQQEMMQQSSLSRDGLRNLRLATLVNRFGTFCPASHNLAHEIIAHMNVADIHMPKESTYAKSMLHNRRFLVQASKDFATAHTMQRAKIPQVLKPSGGEVQRKPKWDKTMVFTPRVDYARIATATSLANLHPSANFLDLLNFQECQNLNCQKSMLMDTKHLQQIRRQTDTIQGHAYNPTIQCSPFFDNHRSDEPLFSGGQSHICVTSDQFTQHSVHSTQKFGCYSALLHSTVPKLGPSMGEDVSQKQEEPSIRLYPECGYSVQTQIDHATTGYPYSLPVQLQHHASSSGFLLHGLLVSPPNSNLKSSDSMDVKPLQLKTPVQRKWQIRPTQMPVNDDKGQVARQQEVNASLLSSRFGPPALVEQHLLLQQSSHKPTVIPGKLLQHNVAMEMSRASINQLDGYNQQHTASNFSLANFTMNLAQLNDQKPHWSSHADFTRACSISRNPAKLSGEKPFAFGHINRGSSPLQHKQSAETRTEALLNDSRSRKRQRSSLVVSNFSSQNQARYLYADDLFGARQDTKHETGFNPAFPFRTDGASVHLGKRQGCHHGANQNQGTKPLKAGSIYVIQDGTLACLSSNTARFRSNAHQVFHTGNNSRESLQNSATMKQSNVPSMVGHYDPLLNYQAIGPSSHSDVLQSKVVLTKGSDGREPLADGRRRLDDAVQRDDLLKKRWSWAPSMLQHQPATSL